MRALKYIKEQISADIWLTVILVASILVAFEHSFGCGGASGPTRVSYSLEVARCIAEERAIVDRVGTSAAEDHRDLVAARRRCDDALDAIEAAD